MYNEVQGNPWCLFVLVHALLILGLKYTYLCNLSWRFILGLHNVSGNEFINKNIKPMHRDVIQLIKEFLGRALTFGAASRCVLILTKKNGLKWPVTQKNSIVPAVCRQLKNSVLVQY